MLIKMWLQLPKKNKLPILAIGKILIFLLLVSSVSFAQDSIDPKKLIFNCEESYKAIRDYTAIFQKQERIVRKNLPEETILLKFQKPFKTYMRWLKQPHKDREVIYVEGRNNNKLIAHEGGLLGFIKLSLFPDAPRAMRGNRFPVTSVGIGKLTELTLKDIRKGDIEKEVILKYSGIEEIDGHPVYKIEAILSQEKEKGYSFYRGILFIDKYRGLLIKAVFYDWDNLLMGQYVYKNLNLNVGLTDEDFDVHNKKYRF